MQKKAVLSPLFWETYKNSGINRKNYPQKTLDSRSDKCYFPYGAKVVTIEARFVEEERK